MREFVAHVSFRGPIRERSVEPYLALLRALRDRRRVRGVLFDISSGGGESVASTDLFLAVQRLNAVKPVYASIGGIGASGAYLAAIGARRVFAYPESLVGSIGVILPHIAVRDLVRRLGISVELVHAGVHKDAFQGYRPLTDEERAQVTATVRENYEGFVARVAEARRRPVDEIRALATGEVWSGRRAVDLHLVDALTDREGAIGELAAAVGVSAGRVVRIAPPRPFLERFFARGLAAAVPGLADSLRESVVEAALDLGGPGPLR